MIMRTFSFAALMLAMAVVAVPASAFIIDDFNDNQLTTANSGTPSDSNTVAGGMIGGQRRIESLWDSGANSVEAEVNAGASSLLNVSLGADTIGEVDIVYDAGGGGFAPVDFTVFGSLNSIAMSIPFDDLPVDIEIIALSLTGESNLHHNPGGGIFAPVALPFLFDDFLVLSGTGADFTAIVGLRIIIDPAFPATDLQIDFIETTFTPPSGVPEPSTLVMAAFALVGFGLLLRKKRQG